MLKNKNIFYTCLILIISILAIILIYNDDFLYKKTIMKITNIEVTNTEISKNSLGFGEYHYQENITGIITNGKNKNKNITIQYEDTYSSVVTDKYKVGDKVFIESNNIESLKRDTYITILVIAFILSMFLVGKYRGLLAIISVTFNTIIFYLCLNLYFNGLNLTLLCILESIIFTYFSLFIASGISKKSISAVASVFASLVVIIILLFIVIKTTNYSGINFNEMSFLMVPVTDVFLPELFIGSLGAIMDVAITMSSSISELIEKNNKISIKELNKSGKEIGKDIMSTMINVLFFTYLCSGLPVFVLALRNGFTMYNYITTNFSLELSRFLVGSIGIVITIPISIFISIKIFKRGEISE